MDSYRGMSEAEDVLDIFPSPDSLPVGVAGGVLRLVVTVVVSY